MGLASKIQPSFDMNPVVHFLPNVTHLKSVTNFSLNSASDCSLIVAGIVVHLHSGTNSRSFLGRRECQVGQVF